MAWTILAQANDDVVLDESATGAGTQTKTFVWATDVPSTFKPGGPTLWIYGVRARLTTDATAGNRRATLQVLDASNNIVGAITTATVQTASLTQQYEFGGDFTPSQTSNELAGTLGAADAIVRAPLGRVLLMPGMKLKILDPAAVAAADSFIQFTIRARTRLT
jgi:hypothetical protein